ncbi:hypothetical protein DM01DRAFT_119580 [Hesseltinella vesiculosa]|uniref:Uncharacterized protein n=1 Tax=Hesseltinella vesiculosa TaxID=101127 RepID=A0A1X2G7G9_9FUNG|nr:hypothetical protein DM01DRAFT_119580 [Hesseltinella vesiculosa]
MSSKDRAKLKVELSAKQRLPKGLLQNIDQACGKSHGWFHGMYRSKFNFIETWKATIAQHFDQLAATIPPPETASRTSAATPSPATKKEEIRTAHRSLRTLLLPTLKAPSSYESLPNEIKQAQKEVTVYSRDMCVILRSVIMKYATNPLAAWYGEDLDRQPYPSVCAPCHN